MELEWHLFHSFKVVLGKVSEMHGMPRVVGCIFISVTFFPPFIVKQ